MPALLQTFIRYALMVAAGWMVSRGWFEASITEAIVAAGLAGWAIIWFLFGKYFPDQRKAVEDAFNGEGV